MKLLRPATKFRQGLLRHPGYRLAIPRTISLRLPLVQHTVAPTIAVAQGTASPAKATRWRASRKQGEALWK